MNIVVIDGFTLNPGDLQLDQLYELGDIQTFARSEGHEVIERLADADIAIVNKVIFDENVLSQLPKLKYIAVSATGYNNIDIAALQKFGVKASNVSNYGTYAVAQHTFALLLEICNQVALHRHQCIEGKWHQTKDFCFWSTPMIELYGKKIGIIGLGNIGLQTAKLAQAFGMEVWYHSRSDKNIDGMKFVFSPEEIFRNCDVISLHCSLNEDTKHLIRKDTLALFKPNAILLNTSRGGLIHEEDLLHALDNGQLYAAGLDVLSVEPPRGDQALIHHPKCIVTPHNAWAPVETRQRLLDIAIDNIKSYIEGNPKNLIA